VVSTQLYPFEKNISRIGSFPWDEHEKHGLKPPSVPLDQHFFKINDLRKSIGIRAFFVAGIPNPGPKNRLKIWHMAHNGCKPKKSTNHAFQARNFQFFRKHPPYKNNISKGFDFGWMIQWWS